jgi:diguanylate cyclase (GGDEF)-like protein/hemerythrin-like metal-binding protein/PAS domain S-box-containing protein
MTHAHAYAVGSPGASTLEASLRLLVDRGVLATAVAKEGRLVCTSPAFDEMFGLAPGTAPGVPLVDLVAGVDRQRVAGLLAGAVDPSVRPSVRPATGRIQLGFDALRRDGSLFEVELLAATGTIDGGPAVAMVANDVTERRRAERQLSSMAFLDQLTNLPNRAQFLDRLRGTLSAARRDGRVFAVIMADLDGFKQVNDTLGHEAGDEVLQTVARRLEAAVRESDAVARQGGDEFAVLLSRVARREDAAVVAERMIRSFDAQMQIGGTPCKVGLSLGIATFPVDGADLDTLVARADAAMYESKHAGKNRYTFAAHEAGDVEPAGLQFFTWREVDVIGVARVDEQHMHLVGLLNRIGDELKNGTSSDAVLDSVGALRSFAVEHFSTEEHLMRETAGCPTEAAHVHEHRKLVNQLSGIARDVDRVSMTLTVRSLHEWLHQHIEKMDRPMGEWLRAHGVS